MMSCKKFAIKINCVRLFRKHCVSNQITKSIVKNSNDNRKVNRFGWFLIVIPASTFCLGTWQIQRKQWKEDLILKLKTLTSSDPIPLPDKLSQLEEMEYQPIHVRGEFLHSKEIHLGPRSLITEGESREGSLLSTNNLKTQGYHIITPFKLENREEIILINRGWVPKKNKNSISRENGQINGVVDVIGIVRLNENRPQFSPNNNENDNQWFYKDLNRMAEITGALPILLDATNDFDVPNGPVGGQTRISLRNEHLSYILTWYSLCAATTYLWLKQFLRK